MAEYIMALDQGTTSSRACLVSPDGRLVAQASEAFPQIYPKPGWVEHSPEAIWSSTMNSVRKVLKESGVPAKSISAIGITNQRETVIMWQGAEARPVGNAIVWQCRRTEDFCETLRRGKKQTMIRAKTGLVIDPYFSASKIRWMLKNQSAARRTTDLKVGTVDSFLLWKLTGGKTHATDASNASRTMLMNIHRGDWDPDLLKLFGVSASMLPEIRPSIGEFGRTLGVDGLPDGIPITGMAGDQQAALFGQVAFKAGEAKCTFGTGSFLLMNTGEKPVRSKSNLLTTIAWRTVDGKDVYALEGGAFICGAAVQWLRDGLGLIENSADIEALAASVQDTMGVDFVPALTGLGAPHWNAEARGVICGLTRGVTKAHVARATLEAMALQNADVLIAMQKDLGRKLGVIRVDGGASANNLLMQMQADALGSPVVRPRVVETTAMGAAYMAGLGAGIWSGPDELRRIWEKDREFKPQIKARARAERHSRWLKAIEKA